MKVTYDMLPESAKKAYNLTSKVRAAQEEILAKAASELNSK